MDLQVDQRVHYARAPTHARSLPAVDLPTHQPALPDRIGDQLRERTALVATSGIAAAIGAASIATRSGASWPLRLLAGIVGATIGAGAAVSGGIGFDLLRGEAPRPSGSPTAAGDVRIDGEPLRVMSFNIHGATGPARDGLGGSEDIERLARVIERERPDVVLLQEVNDFSVQNGFRDVLGELADRLDADGAAFAPAVENGTGRRFGTAVLTFNDTTIADARGILSPDRIGDGMGRRIAGALDTGIGWATEALTGTARSPFGTTPYRPRETTDVLVTTPGGTDVRVLAGHFSWPEDGVDYPRLQVDPIAGLLGAWNGPTVLGADFNVRSNSASGAIEATVFGRDGMTDAFTARGFDPGDPARSSFGTIPGHGAKIDRIYGSRQLDAQDARVVQFEPGSEAPSDHRPVVVDYLLRRS